MRRRFPTIDLLDHKSPKRKRYLGHDGWSSTSAHVDNVRGMLPYANCRPPQCTPETDPWLASRGANVARKRRIKVFKLGPAAFRAASASFVPYRQPAG